MSIWHNIWITFIEMKIVALIFSFFCFTSVAVAQSLGTGSVAAYPKDMVSFIVDEQGETYVKIMNYTCVITAEKSFSSAKEKLKWDKLKYDVKKAYPYAVMAKLKLAEMDAQLVYVKGENNKKEFTKACEKELTRQFSGDMRNLSFSQGKILVKLLDRETGSTTYQIIKEHRGSFTAFMWQSVAGLFGNNLKANYEPLGDDANIEAVVDLIELGVI